MRRFYAPPTQFNEHVVALSPEETRHLRNVLRLKAGDEVQVFDGDGREFVCTITDVKKNGAVLDVVREMAPAAPESGLEICLAVTAYKNDKLDLVIQKAVELGVVSLVPVVSHRSEVGLSETKKRQVRWQKIALEATKQCERARVMSVEEPRDLSAFLADANKTSDARFIFSEKDGGSLPGIIDGKHVTALVGPKGGWEDSEVELAEQMGFTPIKLGQRIMRAETAAITFAALLQHRFGDLA